jgi:hypothetical protein
MSETYVWITVATIAVFLGLARASSFLPFKPVRNLWSVNEEYTQGRVPAFPSFRAQGVGRSVDGLVIGVHGPGVVEWSFSAPLPYPSIIAPYFLPSGQGPSRIALFLRSPAASRSRLLWSDLPLHYRAINVQRFLKGTTNFSLQISATGAILQGLRLYQPSEPPPHPWAALALLIVITMALAFKKRWTALALWLLVGGAFWLRWLSWLNYYAVPLEGDATGYWWLAHQLHWSHPFYTQYREPGFIWLLNLAKSVLGDSEQSARFLGLATSCACVPLTYAVARAFERPPWEGLLAAALVAFNPFSIFMSVQGYQLEFFMVLILGFSWCWRRDKPLLCGLVGGLLCITRVQSVFAVVPLLILLGSRARWSGQKVLTCLVPLFLITAPYFRVVHKGTGSWTGHLDAQTRFYRAAETLGNPTRVAEVAPASVWKFVFREHSMGTLSRQLIGGYVDILFNPVSPMNRILLDSHYARPWNLLWLPFFWVGLALCLLRREGRRFLWLPLFFLSGLPFLEKEFREPRLLFHVAPFVALITAAGVQGIFAIIRNQAESAKLFHR